MTATDRAVDAMAIAPLWIISAGNRDTYLLPAG
jgi:hypothetical protein